MEVPGEGSVVVLWERLPTELQEAIWMHLEPKKIFYVLHMVCKEWYTRYCLHSGEIDCFWKSVHNSSYGGPKRTELTWMSDLKRIITTETSMSPLQLHRAVEERHLFALARAIAEFRTIKKSLNKKDSMNEWYEVLCAACLQGRLKAVKMVVESNKKFMKKMYTGVDSPLGSATAAGDLEVIKYLVEDWHMDPTHRCLVMPYGDTKPFNIAALCGRLDIMRYFISLDPRPDYYNELKYESENLLMGVARVGHLEVVKMLVEELGEQLPMQADRFSSALPLDFAIQSKQFHVADYMISKGAAYNREKLLAAAISYQKDEEVLQYLLNQWDESEPRWPIFRQVALTMAEYGYVDAFSLALEISPDRGSGPLDDNKNSYAPFMKAAIDSNSVDMCNAVADLGGNFMAPGLSHWTARFRPKMLGWLTARRGGIVDSLFDKDETTQQGDTCLHILCRHVRDIYENLNPDYPDAVAMVMKWIDLHPRKNEWLNIKNNEGYTPLMVAALTCRGIEVFEPLIAAGASTEIKGGPNEETVLVMVIKRMKFPCRRSHLRVVKRLLANGADTSKLKDSYQILNEGASKHPSLVKWLLRYTHADNKVESLGGYDLHSFCRQSRAVFDASMAGDILRMLFEYGLDVNAREQDTSLTPIEIVCEDPKRFKEKESLFDFLLGHGAMVTPLCLAFSGRLGNRRAIKTLLQHFTSQHGKQGKKNESEQGKKERKETEKFALLFAIFHGLFDEVKGLVEAPIGVDVNCQWDSSNSLHSDLESKAAMTFLSNGDTPLIVAGKAGEYESNDYVVDYLKCKGADPSIPNEQGQTINSFKPNEDLLIAHW